MGRQEVCVPQEVTVLWVHPLLDPVPMAPSATSPASADLRSVSAVHQGNAIHLLLNTIHRIKAYSSIFGVHINQIFVEMFLSLVSFYCLGSNNTSPSGLCFPGFYCTGGSASPVQHETQEGYYTLEGAFRPEPCPLGTFQLVGINPDTYQRTLYIQNEIIQ